MPTYVGSRLQVLGVDGVVVEAVPLLEGVLGVLVLLLRVPVQHAHVELHADGRAVLSEDALGVVEEIVGVDDADLDAAGLRHGAVVLAAADLRANDAGVLAVVEDAAELVVASLLRHELVEARLLDKRGHAAAVIAGNRVARVADKEGEVELLEQLSGHDSRIARLTSEGRAARLRHHDAGVGISRYLAFTILAIGADATLGDAQRSSECGRLLVRGNEVVSDVFDEDALALVVLVSS